MKIPVDLSPGEPRLGDIVIYTSRNGDGIVSPAIVIRTLRTTDFEVLAAWPVNPDPEVCSVCRRSRQHPLHHAASGTIGHHTFTPPTLSGKGRPAELVPDLDDCLHNVDLTVFGLGGLHQQYNVRCDVGGNEPHSWRFAPAG